MVLQSAPALMCIGTPDLINIFLDFKIGKNLSFLGAAHGADITTFVQHPHGFDFLRMSSLYLIDCTFTHFMHIYIVNFVYNADPNIAVAEESAPPVHWPTYVSLPRGALLEFNEVHGVDLIQDTYRAEQIETLIQIQLELARAEVKPASDNCLFSFKNKVKRDTILRYATLRLNFERLAVI